ncbi:AVN_collapsed_G0046700.mRNA.1.CDS.1 [Saccharomyces cerevisiae]|nr:AVN_collapsed_G0046700.mRNA.1.CDS.1 [Saccharomyces cerevisiae]
MLTTTAHCCSRLNDYDLYYKNCLGCILTKRTMDRLPRKKKSSPISTNYNALHQFSKTTNHLVGPHLRGNKRIESSSEI